MSDIISYQLILPVVIICAYALLVLILSPSLRGATGTLAAVAALGILVAGWASLDQWGVRSSTAYGMVRVDEFSVFFSLVFLLVGLLAVLASARYLPQQGASHGEYYALLLLAVAGMMTMVGSENLLVIFIGLELLSIPLYVLAGLTRRRVRSVESSLKYFLLGAFSTGFILYGLAFIYGATGTLQLPGITLSGAPAPALLLGAGLVIIGFSFKIAAVPFHFWAPDVYQGAPTTVTGFMAAGTKAAAFAALLRVFGSGFDGPQIAGAWRGLTIVLSMLTMTLGNLVALAQTNVKRLLAYSSIAHAGYLLIAVATMGEGLADPGKAGTGLPDDAVQALGFYLVSYALMTMGAFAVAALVAWDGPEGQEGYSIDSYAGLARRSPVLAAVMTVFMLSLAGLPPTAGFVAKLYLFKGAIKAELIGLAIVGILNAVLAATYYLKIVVAMYMKEPEMEPASTARAGLPAGAALVIAVAGTFYLGIFPGKLLDLAHRLYGAIQ
jgi:NADH-quinone oxidoreductase subunit N